MCLADPCAADPMTFVSMNRPKHLLPTPSPAGLLIHPFNRSQIISVSFQVSQ